MPDRKQLIIQLRVDGTIHAETKNIHGDACLPFAAILEDLCDAEAIESGYNRDYYTSATTDDQASRNEHHDNA